MTTTANTRLQAKADIVGLTKHVAKIADNEGKYTEAEARKVLVTLEKICAAISAPVDCGDANMSCFFSDNCAMETKYKSTSHPTVAAIQQDATLGCADVADAREEQRRQIENRDNVLGSKEGIKDALVRIFGNVAHLATHDDEGIELSVDEYNIYSIISQIYRTAIPPEPKECLQQLLNLLGFIVNWSIPLQQNVEKLAVRNQKMTTSYGATIDANTMMLILRPQIVLASKQPWGTCLAQGVHLLNNKYPIGTIFTTKKLQHALAMLYKFDMQRTLSETTDIHGDLQPTLGQAHAVSTSAEDLKQSVIAELLQGGFINQSAFEAYDAFSSDDDEEDEEYEVVSQVSGLTKASTASKSHLTTAQAILKKRQAAKADGSSKKAAPKNTADTSSGRACPHCAFIGHTKKHPAGVTAETCRANPANFDGDGPAARASADWIIEKYIAALKKSRQE